MADEKITVLIVDDIKETRENLKKLLLFEENIEVVDTARDGQDGIKKAQQYQPDIVLMDINMPGIDGIQASKIITQHSLATQIIIMSVQGETDYMRRSMLAGAREFLIKPFSGDELSASVKRVYELDEQRRRQIRHTTQALRQAPPPEDTLANQGKIISIFSPKGGVGCSTLAINLAIVLHQRASSKVIVVDTSLQFGDLAVLLNLQARSSIADIAPHAEELDLDILNSVIMKHNTGIHALFAPPKPEMADLIGTQAITSILEKLREMFDVIIVDMYSSLHDTVLSTLDVSDLVVLVTTPEIPSIKSARLFFEVTDALEYPRNKIQLILNKSSRNSGIRAADIEASIKCKVEMQFPLDEQAAMSAVNRGIPYVTGSSNSDLTKATLAYAKKLYQSVLQEK